jgi:lipopolysaccharide/colanic/teichoic acid biosynthesis glycosyltransferase
VKFRTLREDADPEAVAPRSRRDPRITPYGAWLRVTSIDELPQLWNVLKGEMSLVGPRPEMPFIVEQYDEWQRRRLTVKPGITGLWQILGRKDLPMHENLQYDFYYIRNRSLALDLSILVRTVGAVLSRRGAF